MKSLLYFIAAGFLFTTLGCNTNKATLPAPHQQTFPKRFLVVLGIVQDAGFPQIGCTKSCCNAFWQGKEGKKNITCLALVDATTSQYWLFEATPDIVTQLHTLQSYLPKEDYSPDGIFITHAHTGHYSGLMQLGRESMAAVSIPVWAMPRLDSFLRNNGPWSQLVTLKNIQLQQLHADSAVQLNKAFKVIPFPVPHRDEFSETVGYRIESAQKKILFIPDIDKWEKWGRKIEEEIKQVDIAFIDGTFYKNGELPGRAMSEIPHPFVSETMKRFDALPPTEKAKIRFIHFNHTNPLLKNITPEKDSVRANGFELAEEGMIIEL